jgi:NAD-dependent DNA ligase
MTSIKNKTKKNISSSYKIKIHPIDNDVLLINEFKKNGISFLNILKEKELVGLIKKCNNEYYNHGTSILSDNEYDILKEYLDEKYPKNVFIEKKLVGASPGEKCKVLLPYEMASMDKIKPDTQALNSWQNKYHGPYVMSCKLDGVSGLYSTEGGREKLYTRGDGKIGQDISHLIPYLKLPKTPNVVIRGEFIIPKSLFETKYKTKFANPRNMVAGIINHKSVHSSIQDIHFVAYEVIQPILKPSEQLAYLKKINTPSLVLYKTEKNMTNESLSNILIEWREKYMYEIDGIIVTNDSVYERKSGNPEHAFAFKMVLSEQIVEAKVVDVLWSPSKDGYLKPRIQIEPIHIGGVRIEYATGFNAAFIRDHKIGIGAIVELIRSGDVIPHIRRVIVPASNGKMPLVDYEWNNTNVDIILENGEKDEIVMEKNITGFFKGIGVEGLSSGNISRIMDAGFVSISQILKMTIDDFLKVDGFQIKTATKIYNGIQDKLNNASIVTLMSASNIFGRGFSEKRIELIMKDYPDVLQSNDSILDKINKISDMKGMGEKSAYSFVERITMFIDFLKEINRLDTLKKSNNKTVKNNYNKSHILFDKTIVMTGFRDENIQNKLKEIGAKLGSTVSKNTFMVITNNLEDETSKIKDAKKYNIPIMLLYDFVDKFLN